MTRFVSVDDNDWWLNAIQSYSPSSADDGLLVSPTPGPEHVVFLSENCTKVTAQTGSTSVLHCEVGGVTESMVSGVDGIVKKLCGVLLKKSSRNETADISQ